jgi:ATP-dependent DNA ligase
MQLPVMPPVSPMLARPVKSLPGPDDVPGGLLYEPKWDGFRCIVFRDGDEVELGSRNERPLNRYFPEIVDAVKASLPARCVVDGEIAIFAGDRLDFEALLNRIHPAASRVRMLAEETPASFIAFDLLALGDSALLEEEFGRRRERLAEALAGSAPPVFVTPATDDFDLARQWFEVFEGAGLDGVVAKPLALPYRPDVRAMFKVRHERTADCVVAGYRWHRAGGEESRAVGSLLLGLNNDDGNLQHVGVAGAFSMARRRELVDELAPYVVGAGEDHPWSAWADAGTAEADRMPGAQTRWNAKKDLSWVPLRPELVAEVAYDHMEGRRFRHTAQFRRWRPDRDPKSCTYQQLERPVRFDLAKVLSAGRADQYRD